LLVEPGHDRDAFAGGNEAEDLLEAIDFFDPRRDELVCAAIGVDRVVKIGAPPVERDERRRSDFTDSNRPALGERVRLGEHRAHRKGPDPARIEVHHAAEIGVRE